MRLSQRTFIGAVAAFGIAASAAPAMAAGYNGNWPVTVTHSQFDNGTYCLTLNGGSKGGSASLVAGGTKYPYGSFIVRRDLLVVNITEPLYGQNGALMFIAPASHGHIGSGVFEDIRGGSNFDAGDLSFGMKNGC
jgi:hypothetical protein